MNAPKIAAFLVLSALLLIVMIFIVQWLSRDSVEILAIVSVFAPAASALYKGLRGDGANRLD